MSGIAGILNLNGAPVDPHQLRKMADAMAYRSRDGQKIWHDGSIGLVHCHFWTTPEEVGEEQPVGSLDGRHWITADARIDNRDELIPLLTAKGHLTKKIPTDAEVTLAAYQCWGEHCARHLVGDFAIAIWDAPARRLFMARDVIGLRQLYYALVDGVLYFGTAIGAVVAALPRAPSLNRRVIEDYLRGRYSSWICQTVYEEILRLPPAHSLIAKGNGLSAPRLYYVFGSQPPPDCKTDQEWMEAFRALLDEAVRSRLRSNMPVGILVSGGLDSSAIACVAHDLAQDEANLPTIRL